MSGWNTDWEDVLMNHFGKILLGFVALCVLGTCALVKAGTAEQERFMSECLQDHKQYECTAIWRAGNRNTTHSTVIIPR